MHISEIFETEEDDKALEKADITDILSEEVPGTNIHGYNLVIYGWTEKLSTIRMIYLIPDSSSGNEPRVSIDNSDRGATL